MNFKDGIYLFKDGVCKVRWVVQLSADTSSKYENFDGKIIELVNIEQHISTFYKYNLLYDCTLLRLPS